MTETTDNFEIRPPADIERSHFMEWRSPRQSVETFAGWSGKGRQPTSLGKRVDGLSLSPVP